MGNTAGTSNIVGNLIALVLLERKLGLSSEESAFAKATLLACLSDSDMRQEMHPKSDEGCIVERRSQRSGTTQTEWPPREIAKLPLPRDIGDFAGLYKHPAYGVINFTVSRSGTVREEPTSSFLYGIPTLMRILHYALELHHVTDTLFTCKFMLPHGMVPKSSGSTLAAVERSSSSASPAKRSRRWALSWKERWWRRRKGRVGSTGRKA